MTTDERLTELEANAPHLAAKLRNLDPEYLATLFADQELS